MRVKYGEGIIYFTQPDGGCVNVAMTLFTRQSINRTVSCCGKKAREQHVISMLCGHTAGDFGTRPRMRIQAINCSTVL